MTAEGSLPPQRRRSIVVFGAGAVGGYLGGKLAAAGEAARLCVTVVGRPGAVAAIRSRGLVVREEGGQTVSHPEAAVSAAGLPPCDLVVLTVRGYDVPGAIPDLRGLMGEGGLVLAMQNGVGTEEAMAEALGRERVLVGTLTASVGVAEPGVVERYSRRNGIALAGMDGRPVPPWLLEALASAGIPAVTVNDYLSLRWSKLLLNMLGAATTAILDVGLETVVTDPALFRLEQLAFREAGRVMDALGVRTVALPGYPVPLARAVMRLPRAPAQGILGPRLARSRGGRAPTMRADLDRGKSEMAFLNGAVAREAARLGLPAPVNRALAHLVDELVRAPERRAEFRARPEALQAYLRDSL